MQDDDVDGSISHTDLPQATMRVKEGRPCLWLSGPKGCRTADSPQTLRWRPRTEDTAVPLCACVRVCVSRGFHLPVLPLDQCNMHLRPEHGSLPPWKWSGGSVASAGGLHGRFNSPEMMPLTHGCHPGMPNPGIDTTAFRLRDLRSARFS